MNKRALGAAAFLAAGALTACSAGHTAYVPTTAPGKSASSAVVLASTSPANSLDFTTTGGAAIPAALMSNVYETLVRIDPESGEIVPHLATGWRVNEAGTEYTFALREGVSFSDGAAFNAETAAFSINYVREKWTNGLKSQMDAVAAAEAIGENTLKVTLSRPSNKWLWSMGTVTGAMMHEGAVGELSSKPVGTGPFMVAGFSPNEFVSLTINPDYWGKAPARDVTIRYFPDAMSAVNALQSGGADIVWAVQAPELLSNLPDEYRTTVGTTNGEVVLSMNNQAAPFDDPRVRQAVAYAVDRNAANDILWDAAATDTGGAPVPPTDPWFSGKDYYPHDPDKARELLAEAGATGAHITITVPTLPYAQTISELLYSQLTEVGFEVELESAEFPAMWLAQVMGAKDYQMSIVSHVEPRDITTLFGSSEYYLGYDSPTVRDLFAKADTESEEAASTQLMGRAVDRIMEDMGALTLMNMPNIVLTREGVTGVRPDQVTDAIELRDVDFTPRAGGDTND